MTPVPSVSASSWYEPVGLQMVASMGSMAYPSPDPWHRRYWNTYNRPYGGCGCLYTLLLILAIWWILSWFWPGAYFWR